MKKKKLSKEVEEMFPILAHLGVCDCSDCDDELDKLLKIDLDSTKLTEFSDSEDLNDVQSDNKLGTVVKNTADLEYNIKDFFNKGVDI